MVLGVGVGCASVLWRIGHTRAASRAAMRAAQLNQLIVIAITQALRVVTDLLPLNHKQTAIVFGIRVVASSNGLRNADKSEGLAVAKEDWNNVELNTLATDTLALYLEAKDAYKAYKAAKDKFEAAMQADYGPHIAAGSELKFGYMFGKLSVAVGPKSERKAAAAKPKQGLAEWLAEQAGEGRQ